MLFYFVINKSVTLAVTWKGKLMANRQDFVLRDGLLVLAKAKAQSTSTSTGAIVTPGGIGVGGNMNVGGTITLSNALIYDQTPRMVTTGTAVTLDSFSSIDYRSAKWMISVSNTSTNQFQTSEIWLVHDGVRAYMEQTSVFSNSIPLVEFSATLTNSTVLLQGVSPSMGYNIKVKPTYITA